MQVYVNPRINESIYLKNPMGYDLGKKIISHSVHMIEEIGFEKFTFKKLGAEISSTEASIYRYFPNKHQLLIYLSAWYWEFISYHVKMKTKEIEDPNKKLKIAIRTMVNIPEESAGNCFLQMGTLQQLITEQYYRILRTKKITAQNKSGYFESLKRLCIELSNIFKEIDPDFKYPMTLATSVVEMSINNYYCCNNLPTLTEIKCGVDQKVQIENMISYFCGRMLNKCN